MIAGMGDGGTNLVWEWRWLLLQRFFFFFLLWEWWWLLLQCFFLFFFLFFFFFWEWRLLVHEPVQHGAFFSDAHVNHIPPMLFQPFTPHALVQETTFAMPILTT